jgi:hypothetical protein
MRNPFDPGRLRGVEDGAASSHIDFDEPFHRAPVANDRGGVNQSVTAAQRGGHCVCIKYVGDNETGTGCLDVGAPVGTNIDPDYLGAIVSQSSAKSLSDESACAGHCDCLPA